MEGIERRRKGKREIGEKENTKGDKREDGKEEEDERRERRMNDREKKCNRNL